MEHLHEQGQEARTLPVRFPGELHLYRRGDFHHRRLHGLQVGLQHLRHNGGVFVPTLERPHSQIFFELRAAQQTISTTQFMNVCTSMYVYVYVYVYALSEDGGEEGGTRTMAVAVAIEAGTLRLPKWVTAVKSRALEGSDGVRAPVQATITGSKYYIFISLSLKLPLPPPLPPLLFIPANSQRWSLNQDVHWTNNGREKYM